MEVLPASTAGAVGRLTFRSDLLWRYPMSQSGPPHLDLRNQLPSTLGTDPRQWSRESVAAFLQWCQYEFDLPQFNMEKFQMNGKALCLLTKADLAERSPGSGDVLHNVLRMLVRDSSLHETNHSPLTAPFPQHHWPSLLGPDRIPGVPLRTPSRLPNVSPHPHHHNHHQGPPVSTPGPPPPVSFSVTLSPVPTGKSVVSNNCSNNNPPNSNSQSNKLVTIAPVVPQLTVSPAPTASSPNHENHFQYSHNLRIDESDLHSPNDHSQSSFRQSPVPSSPVYRRNDLSPTAVLKQSSVSTNTPPQSPVQKFSQFSLSEPIVEPNSNGRLLWDFLQQLLNDAQQRYTAFIAWKNREVGVFKIVDPPGLAKLWGIQKNHLSMNYDKMSRALRYYYRVNILRKVQGERHCYQFLRNPSELRSIKNMSLLRQQIPQQQQQQQQQLQQQQQQQQQQLQQVYIKNEPHDCNDSHDDIQPTDLSKGSSSNNNNDNNNTSSNNNNNNNNQQGMKLQLNMWTQQENLKTDSNSNDSSLVTSNVVKTEDTTT